MKNNFAVYDTKFGKMGIFYEDDYIYKISFANDFKSNGIRSPVSDWGYRQIEEYFDAKRKDFNLPIKISGTAFQVKVYAELIKISYGETATYKDIAIRLGNPKGFRAVGNANNKNPLPIIVPCHRIVGTGGSLTGYAYGLDMKRALLDMERSNSI